MPDIMTFNRPIRLPIGDGGKPIAVEQSGGLTSQSDRSACQDTMGINIGSYQ